MASSDQNLGDLLVAPHESLGLELKAWFDPSTSEGKAKIAKGCIALRNNDGGRMLVGYKDDGTPDFGNAPADVANTFHVDVLQEIVTKYSSQAFTIEVSLAEKDGQYYPVVTVPPGVVTPVAAKADIMVNGKPIVRDNAVYVRTVMSNGRVSSSEAKRGDWETLTRICFNNREADIGGFVRRHLSALNSESLAALIPPFAQMLHRPTNAERIRAEMDRGFARFQEESRHRKFKLPDIGLRETAVIIEGDVPAQDPNVEFRDRLSRNAPKHSGWPPWVDLSYGGREEIRPYVLDGGWEAFIDGMSPGKIVLGPRIDFWRIEPTGVFYHLEGLEDDLNSSYGVEPRKYLDFRLQIMRITEVVAIALSFARSLGCAEDSTSLVFGFRWTRLRDREVTCWSDTRRLLRPMAYKAVQDEYVTPAIVIPLETPPSGIAPHVENVVRGLFNLFSGFELASSVVEGIVNDVLRQR